MGEIVKIEDVSRIADGLHQQNKRIIFTNGVFDLYHAGHAQFLAYCKTLGDYLWVGINSDSSARQFKGPTRPIKDQTERAMLINYHAAVDYVTIFEEINPKTLMTMIKPNIWVKCGTSFDPVRWKEESSVVEAYGGEAKMVQPFGTYSASNTIKKILENCQSELKK